MHFLKEMHERSILNKFSTQITAALGKDALKMIYDRFKDVNKTKTELKKAQKSINYAVLRPQIISVNWEELFSIARLLQVFTLKDYEIWRSCFVQTQVGYQSYEFKIDADKLEGGTSFFHYRSKRGWFKFLSLLPEKDLTRKIVWKGEKQVPMLSIGRKSKASDKETLKTEAPSEEKVALYWSQYVAETKAAYKKEKALKKYFSDLYDKYYTSKNKRRAVLNKEIVKNGDLQNTLNELESFVGDVMESSRNDVQLSIGRWLKSSGFDL